MVVILADDLTSALDGAAPFAARGLTACVLLEAARIDELDADVISIDLDSRFLVPSEAEERFERASRGIPPDTLIYKTIDSTLRGNPGPELRGALAGSRRGLATVAPAFPAAGRTTVGGQQFVDGVPLEDTAFARDVRTPVTSGRLADRLEALPVAQYTVHDACTDGELDALAVQAPVRRDVVWVGSPGLAAALARAFPRRSVAARSRPAAARRVERILVIVGSLHAGNDDQLQVLNAAGASLVTMDVEGDPARPGGEAEQIRRGFSRAGVVALVSPRAMIGGRERAEVVAARMGAIALRCAADFDGLVLTGGDTARQVALALGGLRLDLEGEMEPGAPFGMMVSALGRRPFATKAGGFGSRTTLLRCVERLRALPWAAA